MSTSIAPESATPSAESQDGSLTSASKALEGLLAVASSTETERTPARQPEQRTKTVPTPSAEQVPAAPSPEEAETPPDEPSEQAAAEERERDGEDDDTPPARTLRVKLPGGEETEVTEEEAAAGYSRTQDYTRKTMELAKLRKEFEEKEVASVRTERQQYHSALNQMQDVLEALQGKEPEWATLRLQLPLEQYVAQKEAWDENRSRIDAVKAEKARVEAQQQADAAKGFRDYVEQEHQKLIETDPEFGDPTKGPVLKQELGKVAKDYGFTDEELGQVTDHRLVVLLRDAMRYRQSQAKAPELKTKLDRVIATATPGAARSSNPKTKADQARQRLQQTGRVEDAAAALQALL